MAEQERQARGAWSAQQSGEGPRSLVRSGHRWPGCCVEAQGGGADPNWLGRNFCNRLPKKVSHLDRRGPAPGTAGLHASSHSPSPEPISAGPRVRQAVSPASRLLNHCLRGHLQDPLHSWTGFRPPLGECPWLPCWRTPGVC